MKKISLALISIISLSFFFQTSTSNAQQPSECRLESSKNEIVSLGFPVREERLLNKKDINILVLTYQMSDLDRFTFTDKDKESLSLAANNIRKFSNNSVNIHFLVKESVDLNVSTKDLENLIIQNLKTWNANDFENNTFGFVSKVISKNDKDIDYRNVDAVILYGKSQKSIQAVAIAMMFTSDKTFLSEKKKFGSIPWFSPLETDEGFLSNAILLFNQFDEPTLTHEIMHLFGLVDLYGNGNSPISSLMFNASINLLPFEKWILGWLPDSSILCVSSKNELQDDARKNIFSFDLTKGDQSLIIPSSNHRATILDLMNYQDNTYLIGYNLRNEERPPIDVFPITNNLNQKSLKVSEYGGVSAQFQGEDYVVLVSDNTGSRVNITFIKKETIESEISQKVIKDAETRKVQLEEYLKNKAEADAKALADAKKLADTMQKAAINNKITLVCIKGKIIKKVTGVKPVCPAGYKKK